MNSSTVIGFLAAVVCLSTVLLVSAAPFEEEPRFPEHFADCTTSEHCGPNECCVLGMQRYSIPHCIELGKASEYCRTEEDNPAYNRSLSYPNGLVLNTGPLYTMICPCEYGLVCRRSHCIVPSATDTNDLYES